MFSVRKARHDDAEALLALLCSIGWFTPLMNLPQSAATEQVERQLRLCLEDSSHSLYVGIDTVGTVIAYISVHWLPYLFLSGPEGFISELFVAEHARSSGVGNTLLDVVIEEANARGCSRLQLINFRTRESYQRRFYQKAGWEERPDGASFVLRFKR